MYDFRHFQTFEHVAPADGRGYNIHAATNITSRLRVCRDGIHIGMRETVSGRNGLFIVDGERRADTAALYSRAPAQHIVALAVLFFRLRELLPETRVCSLHFPPALTLTFVF